MALIYQSMTKLITTSRLVEKNGVGDIIDALKYLPSSVELMIVGSGELESELKLKIGNLKLNNRVNFFGFVPPEKIPQLLKTADIFVRPSLSEGLGNSFLEAMAAGVPVIGTPVGGIPDFLQNGVTGWFCRPGNPKSIAEAVLDITNTAHQTHVQEVITNARKLVREKYNWNNIARKYAELFLNFQ